MNREEIYAQVRATLLESFEIPEERATLEARLMDDLGLDSIDAIDMAVQLQKITNVRLEEHELRALRTVGDTVELVAQLVARQS
jgi:acyl carrier protein